MAYRDEIEAAEHRREELSQRLAEIRATKAGLRDLEQKEREILRELDDLARDTSERRKRRLSVLDRLEIASPCSAKWEDMVGDARVRFCASCAKNVYDLSQMKREEAEALVTRASGTPCVRLFRRADGTVLTADCPVGRRRLRIRRAAVTTALAAGLLAGLQLGLGPSAATTGDPCPVAMGSAIPVEVEPSAPTVAIPPPIGSAFVPVMGTPPRMGVAKVDPKKKSGTIGML